MKKKDIDVVFLANPNNPTGIHKPIDQIERLLSNYDGYAVIDEALQDYVPEESAASLIKTHPRLVVVRSLSKLFGLAGMRVGYIVASDELIPALEKIVSPFEVTSLSVKLAVTQLQRRQSLLQSRRAELLDALKILWRFKSDELSFSPTQSPTFLVKSNGDKPLYDTLLKSNIKSVPCSFFRGLESENCVRLVLKSSTEAKRLLRQLHLRWGKN